MGQSWKTDPPLPYHRERLHTLSDGIRSPTREHAGSTVKGIIVAVETDSLRNLVSIAYNLRLNFKCYFVLWALT